jgi:hypothetical protein
MTAPRYAHLQGPAYGNGHVWDERTRSGNSLGGPPFAAPVGLPNPIYAGSSGGPVDPVQGNTGNDRLWVRDRHPYVYSGTERTGRSSGLKDPMEDGPARPSIRLLQVTFRREAGTDASRNLDPARPGYRPVGTQDGSVTRIWGGQPGYAQPYGQRGGLVAGAEAPQTGPETILAGTPHGLHTFTVNPRRRTLRTYAATPQMRGPRQDRISNSMRAGQSYSQRTQTQGGGIG